MPFGHLLNFFNSATSGSGTTAPGLSQMFEYLTVPSPFVGTQTVLKSADNLPGVEGTPGEAAMGGGEPNGTAGLHPPFNLVSNYRETRKSEYQQDYRC